MPVSRDLLPGPWPWPWAHHGCGLYWGPLCASLVAIQPFRTVFEILSFKCIGVTTLTFWGHVTPSVTWPLDSQYSVSCRWSVRNKSLSRTVIEILRFKCIGVTTLAFWSCDVIRHMTTRFSRCGFLLVVNMNRPCISHRCSDIKLQSYLGHDLDLLGSHDAICQVSIGFAI